MNDSKKRLAFPIQLLSFLPVISIGSYRVSGAPMGLDEASPAKPIEKCSERMFKITRIVALKSIKRAVRDKAAYVGGTDLQLVNINSRLLHSLRRAVQIAPGHVPRRRRTQCERGFSCFRSSSILYPRCISKRDVYLHAIISEVTMKEYT